jgi:hypothetical protein
MSTNINITVGDNGLLDRARQQQDASRQAQLNREAATQLEAQAIAARTAAFAAQGRDAGGNLITGTPFRQPQIDRRPAANRQGGTTWIYDYLDLREAFIENNLYTYGTYRNGSRIQNYEFTSIEGPIVVTPITGIDEGGRFLSSSTGIVTGEISVYGPGVAELHTFPDQYLLEKPPNAFNKITVQRRCHTPRPELPSPAFSGSLPSVAFRYEEIGLELGTEIASNQSLIRCGFVVYRLSNNWADLVGLEDSFGFNATFGSYAGASAQDMALLDILLPSVGDEDQLGLFLKVPVTFASDTYTSKIEYNGQTGIVKAYINDIEVIGCATGEIIEKRKYQVVTSGYSSRNHLNSIFALVHSENTPAEPPLKIYQVTSTFR